MSVLEVWECLSWMDWRNWRVWWLDRRVSESVIMNEAMVHIGLLTVQNSIPFKLVIGLSAIIIHLNWTISLLYNQLILVWDVSIGLHHSHWLVWLIDWFEFIDLPQLQSVRLARAAFIDVHSAVFESDWMDGLMIQICLNYNPLTLVGVLFVVMIVMIERRLAIGPTTTRTHWQWKVRLNEMMNEQIFLHWLPSKETMATSIILVQWFWRVVIWLLLELDIPQLSSNGIQFYGLRFKYTYSLQSSSTHSPMSSSFDAYGIESVIRHRSDYL